MLLQWHSVNTVTNRQKKLAVLTGDLINEGFFYKKMYARFARRPQKVAVRRVSLYLLPYAFKDAFISETLNLDSKIQTWLLSSFTDPKIDFSFLY